VQDEGRSTLPTEVQDDGVPSWLFGISWQVLPANDLAIRRQSALLTFLQYTDKTF
jgi:hypothetical protein